MNFIKRSNDDLKANRPTLEETKFIPKIPISILVENIRSVYNVGSIFRTADSFGAQNYRDSIEGLRNRVKVRIRWYGSFLEPAKEPMLEFKFKRGILGAKKKFPLSSFFINQKIGERGLNDLIRNSDLPDSVKAYVSPLVPSLLNRYLRKYYRSWDRHYRITVDSDMKCNTASSHFQALFQQDSDKINTVLELKYDSSKDANADTITNHFPFRMTKNSKYVNGIERALT